MSSKDITLPLDQFLKTFYLPPDADGSGSINPDSAQPFGKFDSAFQQSSFFNGFDTVNWGDRIGFAKQYYGLDSVGLLKQTQGGRYVSQYSPKTGTVTYQDVNNPDPWIENVIMGVAVGAVGGLAFQGIGSIGSTADSLSVSSNVITPGGSPVDSIFDPESGAQLDFSDNGNLASSNINGTTTYYSTDLVTPPPDSSIFTGSDPITAPSPLADSIVSPGAANPSIATQLGSVAKQIASVPTSLISKILSAFSGAPANAAGMPVYNTAGQLIGYRAGIGGGFNATGNPAIASNGSTPVYNSQGQLVGYRNASSSFAWVVGAAVMMVLFFILAIGRK